MTTNQPRQPKGSPSGGEFAGRDRAESDVSLSLELASPSQVQHTRHSMRYSAGRKTASSIASIEAHGRTSRELRQELADSMRNPGPVTERASITRVGVGEYRVNYHDPYPEARDAVIAAIDSDDDRKLFKALNDLLGVTDAEHWTEGSEATQPIAHVGWNLTARRQGTSAVGHLSTQGRTSAAERQYAADALRRRLAPTEIAKVTEAEKGTWLVKYTDRLRGARREGFRALAGSFQEQATIARTLVDIIDEAR